MKFILEITVSLIVRKFHLVHVLNLMSHAMLSVGLLQYFRNIWSSMRDFWPFQRIHQILILERSCVRIKIFILGSFQDNLFINYNSYES